MLSIFGDIWILFGIYMFLTLLWEELPEPDDWESLGLMAGVSIAWPIIGVLGLFIMLWDGLKARIRN